MLLADGNFMNKAKTQDKYGYVRPIKTKSLPFNRFFNLKVFKNKNILVQIGVEKIPIVSKNNTIKRYEFVNYIQFIDILSDPIV